MTEGSTDHGGQPSEVQWSLIDDACARFNTAWRAGQTPRIEDFLPAESPDQGATTLRDVLAALVNIDLEWRWKTADVAAREQTIEKTPAPPAPVPEGEGSESDSPRPPADHGYMAPAGRMGEGQGARASIPLPRRPRLADYVARFPSLGAVEELPNDKSPSVKCRST